MEPKTKVEAQAGEHSIHIQRDFDLPVQLLFRAYVEAELLAQWMGTHVAKLDANAPGAYRFETTDPMGQVHVFEGCIHSLVKDQKIIRTFEMRDTGFEPQLEFLEFEALENDRSRLNMHMVFRSVAQRDQLLKMPFKQGINMAHQRLESLLLKQ